MVFASLCRVITARLALASWSSEGEAGPVEKVGLVQWKNQMYGQKRKRSEEPPKKREKIVFPTYFVLSLSYFSLL